VNDVAVCAYCQTAMNRPTAARCPDCGAVHHQDCWQDNGGCAVLGCAAGPDGTPPAPPGSAPRTDVAASAQGVPTSPKQPLLINPSPLSAASRLPFCTHCGAQVAGATPFCTHCGEPVATQVRTHSFATASSPAIPLHAAGGTMRPASREISTITDIKWGYRNIGIAAATVVLLVVAALMMFGAGSEEHTVTGDMSLTAANSGLTAGESCQGTNGFSDVIPGAQVSIEDGSGTTLATSTYGPGVFDGTSCVFNFTFSNVTKSAFYRVLSGTNWGVVQFSYQEMVDSNWSVHLTLGNN
jgi:hypothetical protein